MVMKKLVIYLASLTCLLFSEGAWGQLSPPPEGCDPTRVGEEDIKKCLTKLDEFDQRVMIEHVINTGDPEKGVILLQTAAGIMTGDEKVSALKLALKGGLGPTVISNKAIVDSLGVFYLKMIVKSLCENKQEIPEDLFSRAKLADCNEAMKGTEEEKKTNILSDIPIPPTSGFGYSPDTNIESVKTRSPSEEALLPGEKKKMERELEEMKAAAASAMPPSAASSPAQSELADAVNSGDSYKVYTEVKRGAFVDPSLLPKVIEILLGSGRKGIFLALQKFGRNLSPGQRQKAIDTYIGGGGNLEELLRTAPLTAEEAEIVVRSATSRKEQKRLSEIKYIPLKQESYTGGDEKLGDDMK
ncbi:MAG: hypothetical protein Kow0090_21550 [Myxococcota bacterium]